MRNIIIILFSLCFSALLIRLYAHLAYFPHHKEQYTQYQERKDFEQIPQQGLLIEPLDPPIGGCFSVCWGKEEKVRCTQYSRKYDACTMECEGYLFNNCSSTQLGIIFGMITR